MDKQDKAKPEKFDLSEALIDAMVDDIAQRGAPCMETVEKLVERACYQDPNPGPDQGDGKE